MNRMKKWLEEMNWQQFGIIAYYSYFAINVLAKAFAYDSGDKIYKFFMLTGIFFLAIKLVTTKYTLQEMLACCIFFGMGLTMYIVTKSATMLLLFLTIMGLKNCKFGRLIQMSVYIRLFVAVVMVLGSVYGFFDIGYKTKPDTNYIEMPVYSFGFNEPNMAFLTIFILLMVLLYYNYEKLNVLWFLGTTAVALLFYEWTFCRTGIAVFMFAWVLIIFDKLVKNKKVKFILALSVLVGALFSFCAMVFYAGDNPLMHLLNHFVSGRIYIMNSYLTDQGLAFYPRNQELFYASYYGLIDNCYMFMLLYGGWVLAIVYLIVTCAAMYRLYTRECYKELVMISIFALYGVLEQFVMNAFMNPFILLAGILLYPGLLETEKGQKKAYGKLPYPANS